MFEGFTRHDRAGYVDLWPIDQIVERNAEIVRFRANSSHRVEYLNNNVALNNTFGREVPQHTRPLSQPVRPQ